MEIFIIGFLSFIHVNMCIYIMLMFIESPYCSYCVAIQSGFRVSIWVSGIYGFDFGNRLSPKSVFGAVLGFNLRFRLFQKNSKIQVSGLVAERIHPSESTPLPSLMSWCSCFFPRNQAKNPLRLVSWQGEKVSSQMNQAYIILYKKIK